MDERFSHAPAESNISRNKIADHGAIGNLSTIALVGLDGTVDFLCWPDFDSPSIFAALLDSRKGGQFSIAPVLESPRVVQAYVPESNVLSTRWLSSSASVEVIDLMTGESDPLGATGRLIRRVKVTRGDVKVKVSCSPRFDYARAVPHIELDDGGAVFSFGEVRMHLHADVQFALKDGEASAHFSMASGDIVDFVLQDGGAERLDRAQIDAAIDSVTRRWQDWSARSTYKGRWRSAVTRSALALKLLTSGRHGSIVAAATFGLPETPKGMRNWDYRFTWIRDASFTVYALMRLGYQEEANAFTRWTSNRAAACPDGALKVMYANDGSDVPVEVKLNHLDGYEQARPVRIGNAAAGQLQLDIFGALLDSVYISNKYGESTSHSDWLGICRVVEYVCLNWNRPDAGIWESRSDLSDHLHSRLMCWVAVDRALRLAQKRSLSAPFARWSDVRNEISDDIWRNFWSEEVGHFVRAKGSRDLDGALLMMPLVRFVGARDPAWLATLDAMGERLADGGLVMRYDRIQAKARMEGSFAACAFWYVECLARAGRLEQAQLNFERLLNYGNHLQLFAEEFTLQAELAGNFPQGFTHLALISAAHYLDRALDGNRNETWRA